MKTKLILMLLLSCTAFAKTDFKFIRTDDLSNLVEKKSAHFYVFDANNEKTRTESGVIPGAKILDNLKATYVKTELPKDKKAKLVFYCANEQCTASHDAAKTAVKAGYKDVSVLSDGIQGWVKAGKPVEKYSKK